MTRQIKTFVPTDPGRVPGLAAAAAGMLHRMDRLAPRVQLRRVTAADEDAVLRLNLLEEAQLAPMDRPRLHRLLEWADRFDVVEVDGSFGGFVVTFPPGTGYDSGNYRWFSERLGTGFYYLDRIVLEERCRRRGVARLVYDELEPVAAAYGCLALEVNLEPPNPASLAFHTARGFREVGRLGEPGHLVTLMTKPL